MIQSVLFRFHNICQRAIIFNLFTYLINYYLYPKAETIRRSDFIDNSFDTKFNIKSSEKYFTNDDVEKGLFKMAVNLFENCYFTKEISKKMLTKRTLLFVISSLLILFISFQGFKNNLLAKPLLQLYLSVYVLGKQLKLFILYTKITTKFENLKDFFSKDDINLSDKNNIGKIIKMYTDYETDLAVLRITLNSKIFEEMNPELSKEWKNIKSKYNIN